MDAISADQRERERYKGGGYWVGIHLERGEILHTGTSCFPPRAASGKPTHTTFNHNSTIAKGGKLKAIVVNCVYVWWWWNIAHYIHIEIFQCVCVQNQQRERDEKKKHCGEGLSPSVRRLCNSRASARRSLSYGQLRLNPTICRITGGKWEPRARIVRPERKLTKKKKGI